MRKQKVVIVGGGFAGVKAALELSKHKDFQVTLLTIHSRFEYHGAMYRIATGRSPLEVVVPMSEIFDGKNNVDVVLDSAVELRPETKEVEGESGRTYPYDTLIMAVGYVVNYFGIEGMAEHSESMYSVRDAVKLRHHLVGAFRQAQPGVPVRINVIGAGPTGVEIAADIHNFAKIVAGKHGLEDCQVDVRLIEAADAVLPMLSRDSSIAARARLAELGVEVSLRTKVTSCQPKAIETDQGRLHSDVTIWTAGNQANPLFAAYPDIFEINERGRVAVDTFFQSKDPNIYVIGDAAGTSYSGMAQTAIHNAIHLCQNLARAAKKQKQQPYKPKKPAYVIPIGGDWALLETEDGAKIGEEGWKSRREADLWVLQNFLVYDLAKAHHKRGTEIANF